MIRCLDCSKELNLRFAHWRDNRDHGELCVLCGQRRISEVMQLEFVPSRRSYVVAI